MRGRAVLLTGVVAAAMLIPVTSASAVDEVNTKRLRNAVNSRRHPDARTSAAADRQPERRHPRVRHARLSRRRSTTSPEAARPRYDVSKQEFEFPFFAELSTRSLRAGAADSTTTSAHLEYSGERRRHRALVPDQRHRHPADGGAEFDRPAASRPTSPRPRPPNLGGARSSAAPAPSATRRTTQRRRLRRGRSSSTRASPAATSCSPAPSATRTTSRWSASASPTAPRCTPPTQAGPVTVHVQTRHHQRDPHHLERDRRLPRAVTRTRSSWSARTWTR